MNQFHFSQTNFYQSIHQRHIHSRETYFYEAVWFSSGKAVFQVCHLKSDKP